MEGADLYWQRFRLGVWPFMMDLAERVLTVIVEWVVHHAEVKTAQMSQMSKNVFVVRLQAILAEVQVDH